MTILFSQKWNENSTFGIEIKIQSKGIFFILSEQVNTKYDHFYSN
jgi:hypothetical protein